MEIYEGNVRVRLTEKKDIKKFCAQVKKENNISKKSIEKFMVEMLEEFKKISPDSLVQYITVETLRGNLIGILQVEVVNIEECAGRVTMISIPSKSMYEQYARWAIEDFIEFCILNYWYDYIMLDITYPAVLNYLRRTNSMSVISVTEIARKRKCS